MSPTLRALFNRLLGNEGERLACRHLKQSGMRVLTRNFRDASGEIDIIARDGDALVFVEVKTRRAGDPLEAVTTEKQRRLTRVALVFLKARGLIDDTRCRFDVVSIVRPDPPDPLRIEHVRDAFPAIGKGQMHS
jgi:putative endonuclease